MIEEMLVLLIVIEEWKITCIHIHDICIYVGEVDFVASMVN